jgi:hypothetical protein
MIICVKGKNEFLRSRKMDIYVQKNKIMYTFLVFILFTFASCASNRPLANVHHERIETQMQAVPIGSDTTEIEYRLRCDYRPLCPTDTSPNSGEELNRRTALKNCPPESGGRAKRRGSVHSSLKSTRGVSVQTTQTDSSMRIKLTLRPDTVFVPYTHHIRSDTIVVPDRICETKLQKTQTANVLLILILIAIFIYSLRS